jgi:Tfp pilus assembly protein PilN
MMITVNLKPGLKRKTSGASFGGVGDRLKGVVSRVRDPLLIAAVAAWVGVGGWLFTVWQKQNLQLSDLEPRLEQARTENRRFKAFIQQKKKQELIRDSLLAQIGVISDVDRDRYVWSHVLDEVAQALPAYTWLTEIAHQGAALPGSPAAQAAQRRDTTSTDSTVTPPPSFRIQGRTVDIQAYTKFLRQLEASPWVSDVQPVSVTTVVEQERPVTAFTVKATFVTADSAYIRTVPLSQSVR